MKICITGRKDKCKFLFYKNGYRRIRNVSIQAILKTCVAAKDTMTLKNICKFSF